MFTKAIKQIGNLFGGGRIEKSMEQGDPNFAFADMLYQSGEYDLYALECIRLYKRCAPFFDAINRRAEAFASIPISLYDEKTKTYSLDHDILRLLENPNPSATQISFLKQLSSFYDACGEVFVIATGWDKPLELYAVSPSSVTVGTMQNSIVPIPKTYIYSNNYGAETFYLDDSENMGASYRYWNEKRSRQLWAIRDFNPMWSGMNFRGMTRAQPLLLQIQQFIEADTNNYSILKRGGRPSMAWVWQHNTPMTDPQYQRLKEMVKLYEGSMNAGRQVAVDNIKPEQIGLKNSDMQFAENRKTVKEDIYTNYGVPLSLVSSATMTMDNLKVGNKLFWEQALIPHSKFLLSNLTKMLMPMYDVKKAEDYHLGYNPLQIQPLKEVMLDEAKIMMGLSVLTDNEIRSSIGYDDVDGGNEIYKPLYLAPTSQILNPPEEKNPNQPNMTQKREAMRLGLEKVFTINGERAYSDAQISEMLKKHYG